LSRATNSELVVKKMSSIPDAEQPKPPDSDLVVQGRSTISFAVRAAAEPSLLPRILSSLSRRGVTPTSTHADLSAAGDELVIDVHLGEIDRQIAARITRCLPQIRGVNSVLMSEYTRPAAQLFDQFVDNEIARIEHEFARRTASYEPLVSSGRMKRDQAVRESRSLAAVLEALKGLRDGQSGR